MFPNNVGHYSRGKILCHGKLLLQVLLPSPFSLSLFPASLSSPSFATPPFKKKKKSSMHGISVYYDVLSLQKANTLHIPQFKRVGSQLFILIPVRRSHPWVAPTFWVALWEQGTPGPAVACLPLHTWAANGSKNRDSSRWTYITPYDTNKENLWQQISFYSVLIWHLEGKTSLKWNK